MKWIATLIEVLNDMNVGSLKDINLGNSEANRWLARKTFSTGERRDLYEDLAFLLDNNKTLEVALNDILNVATDFGEKRDNGTAMCMRDCIRALHSGQSIDVGLAEWVPVNEIALIGSGVKDGQLAGALRRAIKIVESSGTMRAEFFSTLTYPICLIFTMFFMMYMCTSQFIPALERVAPRESWHGTLYWFATLSEFFVHNALLLGGGAALMAGWIVWSLPNMTGHTRKKLDSIMPWSLYRDMQGVAFMMNLAALMRANLKTLETLHVLSRYATPWLLERIQATELEINKGAHLGLALKNTGMNFPSKECVNKLMLLTSGDNAEGIIENFAQEWLRKTQAKIKRKILLISVVCFALVGGYLFLMLFASQQITSMTMK
ncbi:TPA: type II secretion system F family protein [Salmonella enterica subsp. salamae serovar 35:g,m,s,t:-]|nr:type II secretion system F family protein [Salmonella enterica subsp. salamae serovar 35:g,m,s,t:-]HCA3549674.1 type II secretion system F family protein [Salmonella enterica subsp. salamae serovar 35:g,m,s,t:-]